MHVLLIILHFICVMSEEVSVVTSKGKIIGQRHDGYDTYFGVPYALVDKEHPFGAALPCPAFNTPFIANDSSIMCPQINVEIGGTLDCLVLNIYVPQTEIKKQAVLVWFHGGSFCCGKAGDYGGEHLVKKHIIVITVNFRLGPYGFFCLHEGLAPGNQGMRDQIEALRWVQKEIEAFGGDHHAVTIAGEGYGGGFVDLHLYSEYETLFDKAIIQSGSIFGRGFFIKPNPRAALVLGNYFGQAIGKKTYPRDVLPRLNKINPLVLLNASKALNLRFAVCREMPYKFGMKHFITQNPYHISKLDRVASTKILIGYNSMELLYAFAKNMTPEYYESLNDIFHKRLEKNFHFGKHDLDVLSAITQDFYLGGKRISPDAMSELANSASDFYLNHAVEHSVDMYMKADATVYKYLFSYIGGSEYRHLKEAGASHQEDLKYLFEWKTSLNTTEQLMMRDRMTDLWSNFVKYGNPTPFSEPVAWPPVVPESRSYLDINVNMNVKHFAFRERMAYWELFWHSYQKLSVIYNS